MRIDRPWYPAVPPAAGAMVPAECIRIGNLIPVDETLEDRWWLLDDAANHPVLDNPLSGPLMLDKYGPLKPPVQVSDEVISAVRDPGIPWLRGTVT
jgi:hypothetical protein